MAYPIAFIFLPRLWSVSHVHNYVTPADFVRGRYGSRGLALSAAVTGILATMPYIALQLVGIQAVLTVMGVGADTTNTYLKDVPLFVAFVVLAIYTYLSGLRAPAAIAFVKDTIIYIFVIVAVFYIPGQDRRLGPHLRRGAGALHLHQPRHRQAVRHVPADDEEDRLDAGRLRHAGARLGAGAVRVPARDHRDAGVQAALGDQAQHVPAARLQRRPGPDRAVRVHGDRRPGHRGEREEDRQRPALGAVPVPAHFPSWFTGVAFAGIIIGALVPAAIMSIGAANLFTRNIFKEFFKPDATPHLETRVAQWASLVVKLGALYFAVELPKTFSINLQLLGGVWILQTFPMLVGGLYTRWFHRFALIPGWLAGMAFGTIAAYKTSSPTASHWASSSDIVFGFTIYIGISAFVVNLAISVVLTLVLKAFKVPEGPDETLPHQYTAEAADKPTEEEPAAVPAG